MTAITDIKSSINNLLNHDRIKSVSFNEEKDYKDRGAEKSVLFKLSLSLVPGSDVTSPMLTFNFKLKKDNLLSIALCRIGVDKEAFNDSRHQSDILNKVNSYRDTSKVYIDDDTIVISSESYIESNIFEKQDVLDELIVKLASNCIYSAAKLGRLIFDGE